MSESIPAGYMRDAQGRLVPENLVKPIDKLRDQTVLAIVKEAKALHQALVAFKRRTFSDVATFVATSAEQYEVVIGGSKGNVTLRTFDGRYRIDRQVQETIRFDEQLLAAKALFDEYVADLTEGANDELKQWIEFVFETDSAGNISTHRVLSLRRRTSQHPKWQQAMRAIDDSISVIGSRSYVRVYERVGDSDRYAPIVLDLAGV